MTKNVVTILFKRIPVYMFLFSVLFDIMSNLLHLSK